MKNSIKTNKSFNKQPIFLFDDDKYNDLSNDAKVLYTLLLDRHNLSKKNGWRDHKGIFIIFSRYEMSIILRCSPKTVTKIVGELRLHGLIHEKRQGLNKPNLIYVQTEILTAETPAVKGSVISAHQDTQNLRTNKTNINHNENIHIDLIDQSNKVDKMDVESEIKKQIEYDQTIVDEKTGEIYDIHKERVDQLVNLMTETMLSKRKHIRVNSENKPLEDVKRKLKLVTQDCIYYVLDSLKDTTKPIKNIRAYLLTALYNAPDTVATYMDEIVKQVYRNVPEQPKNYDKYEQLFENAEKVS